MKEESLLKRITTFYLESGDFNGIPLRDLYELDSKETIDGSLQKLLLDEKISIVYGDGHSNPHVRALPEHHSPAKQAELLNSEMALHACVYPLSRHLKTVINPKAHTEEPYKLELLLGEPQLSHRAFDLSVLEVYRNDPRYHYETDDINGSISVRYKHTEDGSMKEEDQIFLQAFGFAYDKASNKYVAVFLWDLFKLSPEHQRQWKQKEIKEKTTLHPDYFKSSILGQWPEYGSIFSAFIEELRVINEMSRAMGHPSLFKEDYKSKDLPRGFSSLLRPTVEEYNNFAALLDKLISENIDRAFFQDEVKFETEEIRRDGRVEVKQKGTIQILSDWFKLRIRPKDPGPMSEMFAAFKEVRKLRQVPAHAAYENIFDQKYIHLQRELMLKAYKAVRLLRLAFANHPKAKTVEVPDWLYKGKIWSK